jgi:hypothetical protein
MLPAGIGTAIPANERPQNHAFDRAANGIGTRLITQGHNLIEVIGSISLPTTLIKSLVHNMDKNLLKEGTNFPNNSRSPCIL